MISMGKKYRTRDGRDVRLLCVDGPDPFPVIGIIDGDSHATCWTANGNLTDVYPDYHTDLIEYQEPDIRTIWVNVYEDGVHKFGSAGDAEKSAMVGVVSIAQPVTFEVKRS